MSTSEPLRFPSERAPIFDMEHGRPPLYGEGSVHLTIDQAREVINDPSKIGDYISVLTGFVYQPDLKTLPETPRLKHYRGLFEDRPGYADATLSLPGPFGQLAAKALGRKPARVDFFSTPSTLAEAGSREPAQVHDLPIRQDGPSSE